MSRNFPEKILIGVSTVAQSNKDDLKNGEGRIQNPISVKYTLQEINLERTMANVFHYLDGIVLDVGSIEGRNRAIVGKHFDTLFALITESYRTTLT